MMKLDVKQAKIGNQEKDFWKMKNRISVNPENEDLAKSEWMIGNEGSVMLKNPFGDLIKNKENYGKIGNFEAAAIEFSLILDKNHFDKDDDLIISVPSVMSIEERKRLSDILNLINISKVNFIEQNYALANMYCLNTKFDMEKNETIVLIDIGASKIEISKWKSTFSKNLHHKMELIDYKFSDEIGGNLIDKLIIDYAKSIVKRELNNYEINELITSKENLINDDQKIINLNEVHITITKELIKEIAKPILLKFEHLIREIGHVDKIEIVGGLSKFLLFTEVINDIYMDNVIQNTMNNDKSIVIGSIYSWLIQNNILVCNDDIIRPSIYGLNFILNNKKVEVIGVNDTDYKYIKLNRFSDFNSSFEVLRFSDYNIKSQNSYLSSFNLSINGLSELTQKLIHKVDKQSHPYLIMKIGRIKKYDCIGFISCYLFVNIFHKNGESIKTCYNVKNNYLLNLSYNNYHNDFLDTYFYSRNERKRHEIALIKLNKIINDFNNKLNFDTDFETISTENERSEISRILDREKAALEFTGTSRVSAVGLERRCLKLEERLYNIVQRFHEYKERPSVITKLTLVIQKAKEIADSYDKLLNVVNELKIFINISEELNKKAINIKDTEDPTVSVNDLRTQIKLILEKINSIKIVEKEIFNTIHPNETIKEFNNITEHYSEFNETRAMENITTEEFITEKQNKLVKDELNKIVEIALKETKEEQSKKYETTTEKQNETMIEKQNETIIEKQNETIIEGHNETMTEGHNETITEEHNETIIEEQNETIIEEQNETIIEEQNETITEGQNETMIEEQNETMIEGQNETMTEGHNETITEEQNETMIEGHNETIIEKQNETITEEHNETMIEGHNETITEERNETITEEHNETTTEEQNKTIIEEQNEKEKEKFNEFDKSDNIRLDYKENHKASNEFQEDKDMFEKLPNHAKHTEL